MFPALKDTTLAAIVRDEEFNPAGGVERWLRATLPYVESAAVVDTGSADRTLDIVNHLKAEFSNLKVYSRPFDGFDTSRNYSLSKVLTKYVLVLDADELILPEEYTELAEYIAKNPRKGYFFFFDYYYPGKERIRYPSPFNPRLFEAGTGEFFQPVYEQNSLYYEIGCKPGQTAESICIDPKIATVKHFLPTPEAKKAETEWYAVPRLARIGSSYSPDSPWRQLNPVRELFK
jgi:glycosyltransferase involved in cell wall biosynthesis